MSYSVRTTQINGLTKKGHSDATPKLRGIAIGPVMSRVFDLVINNRLCEWYRPNYHQAGFRKKQGCILQIFALFLSLELAIDEGSTLYICLLDYEKAFDYTNRAEIAKDLMNSGIGDKFLRNFAYSNLNTYYVPKDEFNKVGNPIHTKHGVTQGKTSSANLFSYYVSDMHEAVEDGSEGGNIRLLQLADDTTILSNNLVTLTKKVRDICSYSNKKHLVINMDKTKYMEMSKNPKLDSLKIVNDVTVEAVDYTAGYNWLGFNLSYAGKVEELVRHNLNKKLFNICKFYNWLDVNETTPIKLKLNVLYSCMFEAILYSCEVWGDINLIIDQLLKIERSALKRILCVRKSIPDDIIYCEIKRPDISAIILERQYNFIQKLISLSEDDAVAKCIWSYSGRRFLQKSSHKCLFNHYSTLQPNTKKKNMEERRRRLLNSNQTMCTRYRSLCGIDNQCTMYNHMIDDTHRMIITRWRLSCHKLCIETGRYKRPKVERESRLCIACQLVEDEYHALFICKAHRNIRLKYSVLLDKYDTVFKLLNPSGSNDLITTSCYIREIEDNMDLLNMVQ